MSTQGLVDCLSTAARFDPRSLEIRFPEKAFQHLDIDARVFFEFLREGAGISFEALTNNHWRKDETARRIYEDADPEGRLQIHAIICAVIHETTHKVDAVCTPSGVNYLSMLSREYEVLQEFVPHALDRLKTLPTLRLLHSITDELPAEVEEDPYLAQRWPALSACLRKLLAWGDLGSRRPPRDQIRLGWGEAHPVEPIELGIGSKLEPITVCDSFLTFCPENDTSWYLRPLTLFEAKAVANTLLYILEISPDPIVDLTAYFDTFFGNVKDDLHPDYLFLIDAVARRHGFESFREALCTCDRSIIRHLLIVSGGLGWFALHAPPATEPSEEAVLAANPVLRLIAGLSQVRPFTRDCLPPSSLAELCLEWEKTPIFESWSQANIALALERTRSALGWLDQNLDRQIWDPDVRSWFRKWLSLAQPQFADREATYNSRLGNPNNGNPRVGVRNNDDFEIFYADYVPSGGMIEWLSIRNEFLFSYLPTAQLNSEWIQRLDQHFEAIFVPWFCKFCGGLHPMWASRHEPEIVMTCPNTGQTMKLNKEDDMHMVIVPGPKE